MILIAPKILKDKAGPGNPYQVAQCQGLRYFQHNFAQTYDEKTKRLNWRSCDQFDRFDW